MTQAMLAPTKPAPADKPVLVVPCRSESSAGVLFDLVFGILMPLVCLFADPGIFGKGGWLGKYTGVAYSIIAIQMVALVVWTTTRRWPAFLGGVMLVGAMFSGLLGLLLFPLSFLGLAAFIGILGFTPLLTAVVYFRNSFLALSETVGESAIILTALGFLLALAPVGYRAYVRWEVSTAISTIQSGDEDEAEAAVVKLVKLLGSSGDYDELILAHRQADDEATKKRLSDVYRRCTGNDIEGQNLSGEWFRD